MERTRPHGRVIGIDLLPAQPPRGVATFQGDFLSPDVRAMVRKFIVESHKEPPKKEASSSSPSASAADLEMTSQGSEDDRIAEAEIERPSYFDMERHDAATGEGSEGKTGGSERLVDVCFCRYSLTRSCVLTRTRRSC